MIIVTIVSYLKEAAGTIHQQFHRPCRSLRRRFLSVSGVFLALEPPHLVMAAPLCRLLERGFRLAMRKGLGDDPMDLIG